MLLSGVRSATLVHDFLRCSAERVPEKVALVSNQRCLTYRELAAAAERLANALRVLGLRRGSRVVIDLADGLELVVCVFGVLQAGGTFVIVSDDVKRPKLVSILDNCQASVLIISSHHLAWAERLVSDVSTLKTIILSPRHPGEPDTLPCLSLEALLDQFDRDPVAAGSIDRDLACLVYTCLANGEPRGVMLDHSNLVFVTHSLVQCLGATEHDRILLAAPVAELGVHPLLASVSLGATVVLGAEPSNQVELLERVAHERITILAASPSGLGSLLKADVGTYDLSSLRCITSVADTPGVSLSGCLQAVLPRLRVVPLQSFAESQIALYLPPSELDRGPGCVGRPIPGTEAWIEDCHGKILEPGQVGELVIRGRHVMRGYWGDPAATAASRRAGRLPGEQLCYTGDLYKADHEGYLHFVAHRGEIFSSRGHRVVAAEVEDVLYRLPGIMEAAVVGVPDPVDGQALKAFVVAGDGNLTPASILEHCRAYLEPYMVPEYVEIRTDLPRTLTGEVIKSALI